MSKFSVEVIRRIYDDESGDHIEVGPDPDGVGCIELRQFQGDKITNRIMGSKELMTLLAESILEAVKASA